mmetsp:Transcript_30664/g.66266  ORF Transcript_30664/g.66266 Transcript_30664/m.66266 type:complete len:585 (+) Transcript_30664:268-2022(+)
MTGSYYAYDIPAALHQQLADYMPPSSNYETHFNLLYTVYSVPNVILPLFGGTFVDRYGAPLCLTLFALTTFLGATVLSIGVANQSWEVMYLGRFVFGLGMESLCVAQSTILSDWFDGREVALAMGIRRGISVLGKVWNNIMSPIVANDGRRGGIEASFLIGAVLTCSNVVAAGMILVVDNNATKRLKRGEALQSMTDALLEYEDEDMEEIDLTASRRRGGDGEDNPQDGGETNQNKKSGVHITDVQKFTPIFWLLTLSCLMVYGCILPFNNVSSGILLERNFFTPSPTDCGLEDPDECSAGYLHQEKNNAFDAHGDICSIAPTQAPVLPSSVNHSVADADAKRSDDWEHDEYVYSSLTSKHVDCGDPFWVDGCTSDYCSKQNAATEHAGKIMSIPFLVAALLSPLLGHLVDRIGRRAQIIVLSSSLLVIVHLTMALSTLSPIAPLIGQGIAYSLFSAVIWPSVSLTVPKQNTGTAFGVVTSMQNMGMSLFPLAIAAIFNSSGGRYIPYVEVFFAACAASGVVVGLVMNCLDSRYGNKLNAVTAKQLEVTEHFIKAGNNEEVSDLEDEDDMYYSPIHPSEEGEFT